MPIYEYRCSSCKAKFELLRTMSQSCNEARCPSCGGTAERALSVFARSAAEGSPDSVSSSSGCSTCGSTNCGSCGL